ncbi:hypothetical protein MPTK1_6g03530 [Marchantia polymorpha subsp. ruderalis]|uniref:Uncharacterized protein n=2 Tax=Marchantia polymorpha TaxID=3197 RepID=A0AAF6BN60_MARPO|nr:hypothetical protein MARPO_0035s0132 [Marchantia polymorpha]BBN13444.1 hypothetical protein Mp_6g03530 [Marchantia polymorpha subsp. ruderalis]|eukprot:PTQ41364.1 hypothetical protein MARPO_0035s0132 [Marchantia polymorpha]
MHSDDFDAPLYWWGLNCVSLPIRGEWLALNMATSCGTLPYYTSIPCMRISLSTKASVNLDFTIMSIRTHEPLSRKVEEGHNDLCAKQEEVLEVRDEILMFGGRDESSRICSSSRHCLNHPGTSKWVQHFHMLC